MHKLLTNTIGGVRDDQAGEADRGARFGYIQSGTLFRNKAEWSFALSMAVRKERGVHDKPVRGGASPG